MDNAPRTNPFFPIALCAVLHQGVTRRDGQRAEARGTGGIWQERGRGESTRARGEGERGSGSGDGAVGSSSEGDN
jgi:hypothetical protein